MSSEPDTRLGIEICDFRFTVFSERSRSENMLEFGRSQGRFLLNAFNKAVMQRLPNNYSIPKIDINEGSIIISATLIAAGTMFSERVWKVLFSWFGQPTEHDTQHGNIDEGLAMIGPGFVVAH